MGKCLSCCEVPAQPTRNGHPHTTHRKAPVTVHSMTSKASLREPKSVLVVGGGDSQNTRMITNTDNKKPVFAQYPKLPPIRKASADSKRLSLTPKCEFSEAKINSLFEQYRDPNTDAILAEGIEKLCNDLEVKPEEFQVLVLAWKFNAETMCRFTRSEFSNGCKKLKVDSIKGIQSRFPDMLRDAMDKHEFKELYRWTYKFGLDTDIGQRTLPVDMAISLWLLVFAQSEPPILKRWIEFLERHPNIRGIPKDTWDMFLNFCEHVGNDLSNYDDTEAWPSLFDDFVEYENDRENQNVQEKEEKE